MKKHLTFLVVLFMTPITAGALDWPSVGNSNPGQASMSSSPVLKPTSIPQALSQYCKDIPSENAYKCTFPVFNVPQIQRFSQPDMGDPTTRRETLTLLLNGNTVTIEANEVNLPILESCERIALKSFGKDPVALMSVEFTYPKNSPNFSENFKERFYRVLLNSTPGSATSLSCNLTFGFNI